MSAVTGTQTPNDTMKEVLKSSEAVRDPQDGVEQGNSETYH